MRIIISRGRSPSDIIRLIRTPNSDVIEPGLGIKTASYPSKCKQTPPSWKEKGMFLFISFFVGND
jgi:hypothetical protein